MTRSDALDRLRDVDALLYCVGAQKGGTTWLYRQLQRAGFHFWRKEFSYWSAVRSPYTDLGRLPFGPLVKATRRGVSGRGANWLGRVHPGARRAVLAWRMLLSNPLDHSDYAEALTGGGDAVRLTGDLSPSYALLSSRTYAEMHALSPNAKFIFIMRDPVDRLWSGARHRARHWFNENDGKSALPLKFFDDAVADPMNPDFRQSEYRQTIRALRDGVPAEAILFLFYEDLFTEASVERIATFLGIEPFNASLGEQVLKGTPNPVKPDPTQIRAARDALSETYDFVFSEFGDAVPEKWRRHQSQ